MASSKPFSLPAAALMNCGYHNHDAIMANIHARLAKLDAEIAAVDAARATACAVCASFGQTCCKAHRPAVR